MTKKYMSWRTTTKKALVFALIATLTLVGVANADSISGKARWNDRLVLPFTTAVDGTIIATATWVAHPSWAKVWVYRTTEPAAECSAIALTGQTVSCTIVNAPAGDYRAEWWPSSGNVQATLTVDHP